MSVTAAANPPRQLRKPGRHVATASGVGLATALVGGYGFGWRWTGFAENGDLWALLHLLLLPVALMLVPVWQRSNLRLPPPVRLVLPRLAGAGSAILVFGGYRLGWTWTGFEGNLLWDWLELLVLPVAVTVLPLWLQRRPGVRRRWWPAGVVATVGFAVLVVGGYLLHWAWTGFAGNTLWDWLQLMLVPFVLPLVITLLSGFERDDSEGVRADSWRR